MEQQSLIIEAHFNTIGVEELVMEPSMVKRAYRKALVLRLRELDEWAAILKLRWQNAQGVEKFQAFRETQMLERHRRMLEDRLRKLDREKDGLWQDLKAIVRAVIDELPGGFERWIEQLDSAYEVHSREAPGQPYAPAGLSRSGSSRWKA